MLQQWFSFILDVVQVGNDAQRKEGCTVPTTAEAKSDKKYQLFDKI